MLWSGRPLDYAMTEGKCFVFYQYYVEVYEIGTGKQLQVIAVPGLLSVDPATRTICTDAGLLSLQTQTEASQPREKQPARKNDEPATATAKKVSTYAVYTSTPESLNELDGTPRACLSGDDIVAASNTPRIGK